MVALLLAVLLGLAGAGAWRATGGRWAVVETASMGTAVPVGSLIVTRPVPLSLIEVGDIVTYRPPNLRSMYTHRVVAVQDDGRLRVQGDANATPDPWPVSQNMLVGQVVGHWRGLGWLLRALPTVLLGFVVLLGVTHLYVALRWRSSVRVVGTCLVLGAATLLLRPFVHPVLVATTIDTDGTTIRATVASTGMLPTRVTGAPGQHVDLLSGQIGSVVVQPSGAGDPMMINGTAHLTGWWLVVMGLVCALPLLWVLIVGLAPVSAPVSAVGSGTTAQTAGGATSKHETSDDATSGPADG
ncbi:MAG: signal peptidase I [Janthinobacterium lividum]